jgi:hypothetical protein
MARPAAAEQQGKRRSEMTTDNRYLPKCAFPVQVLLLGRSLSLRGRLLPVGWEVPPDLSEPDWREIGRWLGRLEHGVA